MIGFYISEEENKLSFCLNYSIYFWSTANICHLLHISNGLLFQVTLANNNQISLHLLASALLSHLPSTSQDNQRISTVATIIDTVGSFPLTLLAQILKSRIATSHAHSVQPDENQLDKVKIEQLLQQCLEMVAISRVFDIEGLWEVLGEIGHEVPTSSANEPSEPPENKGVEPIQSSPDWPEINDSQESISISSNHDYDLQSPPPPNRTENKTTDSGTEIIIIDTLSQIITELFSRKDKASGTSPSLQPNPKN